MIHDAAGEDRPRRKHPPLRKKQCTAYTGHHSRQRFIKGGSACRRPPRSANGNGRAPRLAGSAAGIFLPQVEQGSSEASGGIARFATSSVSSEAPMQYILIACAAFAAAIPTPRYLPSRLTGGRRRRSKRQGRRPCAGQCPIGNPLLSEPTRRVGEIVRSDDDPLLRLSRTQNSRSATTRRWSEAP